MPAHRSNEDFRNIGILEFTPLSSLILMNRFNRKPDAPNARDKRPQEFVIIIQLSMSRTTCHKTRIPDTHYITNEKDNTNPIVCKSPYFKEDLPGTRSLRVDSSMHRVRRGQVKLHELSLV